MDKTEIKGRDFIKAPRVALDLETSLTNTMMIAEMITLIVYNNIGNLILIKTSILT
jgi:hypothetical protein